MPLPPLTAAPRAVADTDDLAGRVAPRFGGMALSGEEGGGKSNNSQ